MISKPSASTSATSPKSPITSASKPSSPKRPFEREPGTGRSLLFCGEGDSRLFTSHRSRFTSIRHCSDGLFHFRDVYHHDGVPRAAIQEASVRSLADALLASDAQNRIHLDAPKRIMILVRHPEHAVFHGTILHARRRTRAARAAFRDDRKFLWLLLARGGDPFGARLVLLLVGHHSSGLRHFTLGHEPRLSPRSPSFCHTTPSTTGFPAPLGTRPPSRLSSPSRHARAREAL